MDITMGNFFSGSGTWELAAKICGIKVLFESEIEKFPVELEAKRFPEAIQLGDISKVNGAEIPAVDILTNSSPCQDISTAGKRKGMLHISKGDKETTRSGLFSEVIRITKEMREHDANTWSDEHIRPWIRPRIWCWENVPGAFSSNSGEDFRRVIEEVARIIEPTAVIPKPAKWGYAGVVDGNGWQIAWRTLDAQFFGVAQRRRRCFLVGDLGGHCAAEILFERESVSWHFKEISKAFEETSRSLGERISDASRIVMAGIREDETGVGCVKEKAVGFDMYNHSVGGYNSPAVFHGDLSRE